jgi:ABC-2 type transport system ATP-binding protein
MSVLECRGLRRRFGELVAVDGVGFAIGAGETYGLLGPNGAGKTTTISMIAGLLARDGGTVTVAGEPMTTRSVRARNAIGYVPQDLAIYPDLSGRENLMFFARLYGMSTGQARRRSAEVLTLTGLADRAGDQAKHYSGGMKRRLNIGIGLLHRPKLLILDEPTAGVDPQSRNAILESVGALSGAGMAVLYTTHYMEEAERLCDWIGIIDHGTLIAEGTRAELVGLVGEGDRVRLSAAGNLAAAADGLAAVVGPPGPGRRREHRPGGRERPQRAPLDPDRRGGGRRDGQVRGGRRTRPRGGLPAPDRPRPAGLTRHASHPSHLRQGSQVPAARPLGPADGDRGPARPGVHLQRDLQRDLRRRERDQPRRGQRRSRRGQPAVHRPGPPGRRPERADLHS